MRIMNGDCFEIMEELDDHSIDLVLADPPYGLTNCRWDTRLPFDQMWQAIRRVVKPNGAVVMTATQPFTSLLITSNLDMFSYCWIWEKNNHSSPLLAKKQPLRNYEDVVVFYAAPPLYQPQGLKPLNVTRKRKMPGEIIHGQRGHGERGVEGLTGNYRQEWTNYPRQVQRFPSARKTVHGTQKPVELMEYMIKTYTRPGETVLDFVMGSGTAGVAAANTGRKFIGIEKDAQIFDIALGRIRDEVRP
jgi:site-specific DNA-methyltransferase (adenine-specific)